MKVFNKIILAITFLLFVACSSDKNPTAQVEESDNDLYRPILHFTPPQNWMNDPNGMFFYKGLYHLFYQYNPFGIKWGHMSWGHATSKDMVSWEHHPVAIPEENDIMIFSGSAVVDWKNTSGFGTIETPPIIAIYTGYHTKENIQEQSIAYSLDEGMTWTKYENNPVLNLELVNFRDPKVMWYAADNKWIMAVSLAMDRKIQFYGSKDLKKWEFLSDFGPSGSVNGQWECPDLFQLTTKEGESKWILEIDVDSGSPAGGCGAQYFIGEFDGTVFTADNSSNEIEKAPFIPLGKLIDNFEDSYDFWEVNGVAFGDKPVTGTLENQNEVTGFFNKKLVNSFEKGDESTGTLKSKEFIITEDYINFLVGGGSNIDEVGISLFVNSQKVNTTAGGNSEHLIWASWDVKAYKSKKAYIEIYDNATNGWGHINVDHITQSSQPSYNVQEKANWIDYGKDFYGAVTWSGIPENDGRKLWIGWMNNWQYATEIPTEVWRSSMTIPREVLLDKINGEYILRQEIVKEIESYRKNSVNVVNATIDDVNQVLTEQNASLLRFEIEAELNVENMTNGFEFEVSNNNHITYKFSYDKNNNLFTVRRPVDGNVYFHFDFPSVQQLNIENSKVLNFRILVDRSSVELFLQNGKYVITNLIFPKDTNNSVKFNAHNKDNPIFKNIKVNFY